MTRNPYVLVGAVSLLLGVAAGFVMHRSDYCIVCTFRNYFLFGHTFMLRCLTLLIVSTMVLFEIARQLGFLSLYPFPFLGSPSLANVVGGFLFGIGMVLAGGCVVGTLYKMGSGSFLSFLAFLGLICGSVAYAEFHPGWSSFAAATTFCRGKVTLPQLLEMDPLPIICVIMACVAYPWYRWVREGTWRRDSPAAGYLQPWRASLLLAALGTLSYVIIGMPFGVTTAYAKIGAYLESLAFPEHVARLAYFQGNPLNYLPPFGDQRLIGGAGPRLDAIAAIQFPLIAGITCGGALSAVLVREFRVFLKVPPRQCISAFAGGVLMGLSSRMAPACSVWHLFGGLPTLALQSMLFLVGLVPGALMGSRILVKGVVK